MTKLQYIAKSFLHYFKANFLVALGIAISTMVLTGSLVIGDSVRHSLKQATFYRLGETTHLVSLNERYFRQEMAAEMEEVNAQLKVTPLLLLEGMAISDGGQQRANKVQVIGIDTDFDKISKTPLLSQLQNNEIAISKNLAEKLQIQEGDNILVRIKKASLIPLNAPFVSAEETSTSMRATIKKVVSKEELGRFSLKNSQTAPYNLFVSIERLNRLMELEGKANQLLISTNETNEQVAGAVKKCLTPADAGLSIKTIENTSEVEISTERVFLEEKISETLKKLPEAELILTYFVNGIEKSEEDTQNPDIKENQIIPYSFVSSLQNSTLAANEIIINQWAADDINVKIGDKIKLGYFEIGPLRELINKETEFVVKKIIPMNSSLSDPSRVPHLPGLSDAGHCREWEAGVPIDLNAVREKDEKYWDDYKGTPKAFVNNEAALKMWSNRFGNYTAVRFPAQSFNKKNFNALFVQEINPEDLGMAIQPIREQGISAAQNGTDFSGLFIGLSFFILLASIILTTLLFRLNLENRTSQIGLFSALGFTQKLVQQFYLFEGFIIAVFGSLLGLIISVFYTKLVFNILNTLWFDIVRTNVLEIKILPATLIMGTLVSIVVSLLAIFVALKKFQNRKVSELQKQVKKPESKLSKTISNVVLYTSLLGALIIFAFQIIGSKQLNSSLFFVSGALLLMGFLLQFRKILVQLEQKNGVLTFARLSKLNLAINKGRSLTIVILFALGTFIVVSTGSNKLDLFANAQNKTSGTGGFLFFAETTMPVLFNINNKEKRAEEGIFENFETLQFRKVEGDDASCLNLNRISQPAILGVNPENLADRFTFATKIKTLKNENPWLALTQDFNDGTVPAIADQTVIQWGLGMKVGDILMYQNELGDTLRLKLIAGTKPSIFQGYVLISNQNFLKNYPTSSGTNLFLIEGEPEKTTAIANELHSVFRDYGWEMQNTAKRLVEFYSITNTYLSIFLALGALGLLLGTIGLAVILARTIIERRREISVMQALGFSTKAIFKLFLNEYTILLFIGVAIGFVTAIIATLPAFLSANTDVSFSTVALVTTVILVNGICWIVGLSWFSLQKKSLIRGLRIE